MNANRIILLNGFPGVGKLTIARAVQSLLSQNAIILLDNHTLIDTANTICPSHGNKQFRSQLRSLAFSSISQQFSRRPNHTLILTECLANTKEDIEVFTEYLDFAKSMDVPIWVFDVECEWAEHRKRFQSEGRYEEGKGKLRNLAVLEDIVGKYSLCDLERLSRTACEVMRYKKVELDSTKMTAEESARLIMRIVGVEDVKN